MKINNLHLEKIQQGYLQQKKDLNTKKKGLRRDSMEISVQAREIKQLEAKLAEIPEIRQERVEGIKTALARGEYRVDSRLLARRILAEMDQE